MNGNQHANASAEIQSLKRAVQYIQEGVQELLESIPPNDQKNPSIDAFKKCNKFATSLLDWLNKMPVHRVRPIVISLVVQIQKKLRHAVQEGFFPERKDDTGIYFPHIRKILMEIGPEIQINTNNMAAFIFLPSELGPLWNADDLRECLTRRGISFGINTEALNDILSQKMFDRTVRVAVGKNPVIGSNAQLEDRLSLMNHSHSIFKKETERKDFKQKKLFHPVSVGDIILKKIPAKEGQNGMDIFGHVIDSPAGIDFDLPKVAHCELDADQLNLVSKVDGCAYSENGQIHVTPALAIKGNVDYETGNIDTRVSVTVGKDVLSDFSVVSKQDIAVAGVIEAATIRAGGSIFCQRGINGKGKAVLHAGKNIEAKHINGATVFADGVVLSKGPIIKSKVTARRIFAEGNDGQIIGGRITAWEDICAKEIGSEIGVDTDLILGSETQHIRNEVEKLAHQISLLKEQKRKAKEAVHAIQKDGSANPQQRKKVLDAFKRIQYETITSQKKLDKAKQDLSYSESCKRMVRAEKVIHAGTRIRILNQTMVVKEQRGPTSFVWKDGQILTLPYQERTFHDVEGQA